MKQLKDAETEFKAVIEHETNDDLITQTHCMLGNTLLEQNKVKSALKEFDEVLEEDDKNIHALTGRAAVHIKRNEYEDAEELLKKVIKLDKKYPVAYLNLVMLYKHQGREKDLKKMVKLAKRANLEIQFD
jgi:Tfp pilus assembly protein PilF